MSFLLKENHLIVPHIFSNRMNEHRNSTLNKTIHVFVLLLFNLQWLIDFVCAILVHGLKLLTSNTINMLNVLDVFPRFFVCFSFLICNHHSCLLSRKAWVLLMLLAQIARSYRNQNNMNDNQHESTLHTTRHLFSYSQPEKERKKFTQNISLWHLAVYDSCARSKLIFNLFTQMAWRCIK